MPKAKKLPSGSWRIRVLEREEIALDSSGRPIRLPSGKLKKIQHMKSFTVSDPSPAGRRECERLAAVWAADHALDENTATPETVRDMIAAYIHLKEGILSPTTIRSYRTMQRCSYDLINDCKIHMLKKSILQRWINQLSVRLSPKTVRNVWGLLTASLDMYYPTMRITATLPTAIPRPVYTPSDEDVRRLIESIHGTVLERAVILGAFCGMRRGEICALTDKDIRDGYITVSKSLVRDGGKVIIKAPKTPSSYRTIKISSHVEQLLTGISGRIVPLHPEEVTAKFRAAVAACGLPHFRFHDLRHYSASIMHALGIPDQYVMDRHGWKTDRTLKAVYRNIISTEKDRFNEQINSHIDALLDGQNDTT